MGGALRRGPKEQLQLSEWELERIGDMTVGGSLDLAEAAIVLEESLRLRLLCRARSVAFEGLKWANNET
jgi:hypothetical protein